LDDGDFFDTFEIRNNNIIIHKSCYNKSIVLA